MIAIHHKESGFSYDWVRYCKKNSISYKCVNCYSNNIMQQIADCDALMWHFHHADSKDVVFAKQLIYSLSNCDKVVFPDFNTAWHFDDKVGQYYLLKAIDAPMVPTYIFYDKKLALQWIEQSIFPKVFKLRRGSGSAHVRLVKDYKSAKKIIKKAFSKGFSQYDATPNLQERWRKYCMGLSTFSEVLKGVLRLVYTTDFDKVTGNEKGYVYFQDFIPYNKSDTRVIVIDGKAFAIKRMVRKNDFRASGSGINIYEKENFDEETIQLSFEVAEKLKAQTIALDFIYDNGSPKILEISFGFTKEIYEPCPGYWDRQLKWIVGEFNPQEWMVDSVLKQVKKKQLSTKFQ